MAVVAILLLGSRPAAAEELRCAPAVQYVCDAAECQRATEGFQHAESFAYDSASGILSACLWTSCYSAAAKVYGPSPDGETTIIGELIDENPSSQAPPRLVSLTIDAKRNFVAIWQYAGLGPTFDQGVCQ